MDRPLYHLRTRLDRPEIQPGRADHGRDPADEEEGIGRVSTTTYSRYGRFGGRRARQLTLYRLAPTPSARQPSEMRLDLGPLRVAESDATSRHRFTLRPESYRAPEKGTSANCLLREVRQTALARFLRLRRGTAAVEFGSRFLLGSKEIVALWRRKQVAVLKVVRHSLDEPSREAIWPCAGWMHRKFGHDCALHRFNPTSQCVGPFTTGAMPGIRGATARSSTRVGASSTVQPARLGHG